MAIGIYAGAGGVKTVSGIYVGAGGVKTVSAVYVGAGSVKQVWPAWSNGDQIFEDDLWYMYVRDYTTSGSWGTYSNSSNQIRIDRYNTNYGLYFAAPDKFDFTNVNYVRIYYSINFSTSSFSHIFYTSVGSSVSTAADADSGVGSLSTTAYSRSGSYTSGTNYLLVDTTSCSRNGYFKFEMKDNVYSTDSNDWSAITLGAVRVYTSKPSTDVVGTITMT